MDIKTRRLIYLIFIAIFVIAAPLLLFYTAGYRYNLQKGKVEQVGVLFINTLPKDAQIFLNDQLEPTERPLRLSSLRPNYYQVKVVKENYYPWQKTLEVKSKISTLAYDVVLFKDSSPVIIAEKDASAFALSPKNNLAAISNKKGLWVKNLETDTEKLIWQTNGADIDEIDWSDDSKKLLVEKNGQFFVINTNGSAELALSEWQKNLQTALWGNDSDTVFAQANDKILEIALEQKQPKITAQGTDAFSFLEGTLYFVKKQNERAGIYKHNSLNFFNKMTLLADLPPGNYRLNSQKNNWLSITDGNKIYLIDLSAEKLPILTLDGGAAKWGEGSKNNFLYYFDKSELWIFDPKLKQSYMLNRYDNDIRRVIPLPDIPYYVLQQGQNILLSEIDDRDQRQQYLVFQGHELKDLQIDTAGKNIYFLDKLKNGHSLFKLEIQ